MLGCYLDPRNDYAFRRIFGDEKREHVLRHFLNSVLELQGDRQIEHLRIADPHQVPKLKDHKETILDVRCKDQCGREFIVEMQVSDQKDFEHRAVYYVAKSYVNQLRKGDDYTQLRKVTLLSILDFPFLEGPDYLSTHLILDKKTGEHKLKDFEFAFLELAKFHKKEDELRTIEEKWSFFFKYAHKTPIRHIPSALHDPDIEEAFQVLEEIGRDQLETQLYEKADMDRMDRTSQLATSYEKGHKEGHKEGHKKGRKEGEERGLKRGKQQIARKLRSMGLDVAAIAKATGLSHQEIAALDP